MRMITDLLIFLALSGVGTILALEAGCSDSGGTIDAGNGVDGESELGIENGLEDGSSGEIGLEESQVGESDNVTLEEAASLDPCRGTICDQPEATKCSEKGYELMVYEAIGDCDFETGTCVYDPRMIKCLNGCSNGQCIGGGDLCAEAVCNGPPRSNCAADGQHLTVFAVQGECESSTGRCLYDSTEVVCDYGCEYGRCMPPAGSDAALWVPANSQFCSFFWGGEILDNFLEQSRVTLKPGVYPFKLDQAQFELDWVDKLELAPDADAATVQGPAAVSLTLEGTMDLGRYILAFEQGFQFEGRSYQLNGKIKFNVVKGRLLDPLKEISSGQMLSRDDFFMEGQFVPDGLQPRFGSCGLGQPATQVTFSVKNGDQIQIGYGFAGLGCRNPEGAGCAGEPYPGLIESAHFQRDAVERDISDFFEQSFSTVHHWDGRSFLLVFNNPIEMIHAVLIPKDPINGEATEVQYLDTNFNLLEKSDILSTTLQ